MGCEIAATSISKIFFARFTIIMHFVIKLPMLQNPVLVKYTCNYINQLAYNCTLLFLIPKTLLGTFEKNYTPWFCFLGGGGADINTTVQERLDGFKYHYVFKSRFTWKTEHALQCTMFYLS